MAKEDEVKLDPHALEKFDPTEAQLREMVSKTSGLTATDLKDKAQLEVVRKARIELKKTRVAIEKYGKGLREDALKFQKAVIAKEKDLIGIIEPEEDRLAAIEEEAEKLAIREERLEKLPQRKERLAALEDGVEVSDEDLLLMDSTQFEAYYNSRVADKNERVRLQQEADQRARDEEARKEQERKDAELREREEAAAKKEQELKAEEARLAAEKDAREREERAREEERVAAEKRAQEAKEAEKRAAEEAARKEAEAKAKRERADKYKKFRSEHGWTEATKGDFYEQVIGTEGKDQKVVLYKKVGEFALDQI